MSQKGHEQTSRERRETVIKRAITDDLRQPTDAHRKSAQLGNRVPARLWACAGRGCPTLCRRPCTSSGEQCLLVDSGAILAGAIHQPPWRVGQYRSVVTAPDVHLPHRVSLPNCSAQGACDAFPVSAATPLPAT